MAMLRHICALLLVTLASSEDVCESDGVPSTGAALLQAQTARRHSHTDNSNPDGADFRQTGAENTGTLMTWQQAFKEDPKLFEGCSKVFLDVGSNRGTHVRKLFEPEKYSGAPYLRMFDEGFGEARSGPSSETGICTFAFEANPRWTSRLQEIEKAYAAKGWRAKWFAPTAVSDSSSNLTFYLNDQDGASSDWGASMVKEHEWAKAVQVPAIDLSGFMEELAAHASPGYRLMKMDIESAEFLVLPTFLDKNLLCKNVLDKLTIEWHVETLPTLDEQNKARETKNKVEDDAKCAGSPATIVEDIDDESFLEDGKPLP